MNEETVDSLLQKWRRTVNAATSHIDDRIFTLGEEIIRAKWALHEQKKKKDEAGKEKTPAPPPNDPKGNDPKDNDPKNNKRSKPDDDGQDNDRNSGTSEGPASKKQKLDDGTGKKAGTDDGKKTKASGNTKKYRIKELDSDISDLTEDADDSSDNGKAPKTKNGNQGKNGAQHPVEKPQGPAIPVKPKEIDKGPASATQQAGKHEQPLQKTSLGKIQEEPPKNTAQSYKDLDKIALKDIKLENTNTPQAVEEALNARNINRPLNKPNGIGNKGNSCFANSVLQCLAAVLEPKWLKKALGTHLQLNPPSAKPKLKHILMYPPFNPLFKILECLQSGTPGDVTVGVHKMLKFLDTHRREIQLWGLKGDERKYRDKHRDNIEGSEQEDCRIFLEIILNLLEKGAPLLPEYWDPDVSPEFQVSHPPHELIKRLFFVETAIPFVCDDCGLGSGRTDGGKLFLTVTPSKKPGEEKRRKTVHLAEMINNQKNMEEGHGVVKRCDKCWPEKDKKYERCDDCQGLEVEKLCKSCRPKRDSHHTSRWQGLKNLPEILTVQIDFMNSVNRKEIKYCHDYQIPEFLDMAEYSANHSNRTHYILRGFIKHSGTQLDDGHYRAYIRGQEGRWWRCSDRLIDRMESFAAAVNDHENGENYMLFYERLLEGSKNSS
jgi:hypothetical protein